VPVGCGDEVTVLDDIGTWTCDTTDRGIVYLHSDASTNAVHLLPYNLDRPVRLGLLPFRPARMAVGWAVSLDGRTLLTNQVDRFDSDLMLVDMFR
jgi:hypothetical protein